MKTRNDVSRAFGPADSGFKAAVGRALRECEKKELEEKVFMKRKLSVGLLAAAICMVLAAAVALASAGGLGFLDHLMGSYENVTVLPAATDMLQNNPVLTGGETEGVSFAVREAICDGNCIYLVVTARAADEAILLTGPDGDPENPMSDLGAAFAETDENTGDYAKRMGKTRIVRVNVNTPGSEAGVLEGLFFESFDYALEEDGTLALYITGTCEADPGELTLPMTASLIPYALNEAGEWAVDMAGEVRADMRAALTVSAPQEVRESAEAVDYATFGLTVDKVTLRATAMGVYYRVDFRVSDANAYEKYKDEFLFFRFVNENGEPLGSGASVDASITPTDETCTAFYQKGSFGATDALPDAVRLQAYIGGGEMDETEVHEIAVK